MSDEPTQTPATKTSPLIEIALGLGVISAILTLAYLYHFLLQNQGEPPAGVALAMVAESAAAQATTDGVQEIYEFLAVSCGLILLTLGGIGGLGILARLRTERRMQAIVDETE